LGDGKAVGVFVVGFLCIISGNAAKAMFAANQGQQGIGTGTEVERVGVPGGATGGEVRVVIGIAGNDERSGRQVAEIGVERCVVCAGKVAEAIPALAGGGQQDAGRDARFDQIDILCIRVVDIGQTRTKQHADRLPAQRMADGSDFGAVEPSGDGGKLVLYRVKLIEDELHIQHARAPEKRRTRCIGRKTRDLGIAVCRLDHNKAVRGIEIRKRRVTILGRDIKRRPMPVREQKDRKVPIIRGRGERRGDAQVKRLTAIRGRKGDGVEAQGRKGRAGRDMAGIGKQIVHDLVPCFAWRRSGASPI